MKVRDVIRDLGDEVRVQIYKVSPGGYEKQFPMAYYAHIVRYHAIDVSFVRTNMDKEVDHCDYRTITKGRGFETYCDIYLKADSVKTDDKVNEEKPSTTRIDYSDLEKKWNIFRKQLMIHDDFEVKAWLVSAFLHALAEGTLIEMEDKDLS